MTNPPPRPAYAAVGVDVDEAIAAEYDEMSEYGDEVIETDVRGVTWR
jgi:hypothetical protein